MAYVWTKLLVLAVFIHAIQAAYYLPNGTEPNDEWAAPCSSDSTNPLHNIACHTKWANPPGSDIKYGPTQDECMPNGLCQNRGSSSVDPVQAPWTKFYRVYCIEKDFKGCLDVCSTGNNAHDVVQLTPCDGTSTSEKWCCGDTTNCCAPEFSYKAVYIPRNFSSASNGLAPVQTPSNSTQTTGSVKGLSSDAKIGLGVGIGVGWPLMIALGTILGLWIPRRQKTVAMEEEYGSPAGVCEVAENDKEADSTIIHEVDIRESRAEMA